MGGLAGGLYNIFGLIGELFFSFLIGSVRASRPQMRDTKVRAGGFIVFGVIGAILFLVYGERREVRNLLAMAAINGLLAGLLLGIVIASILISYVHKIEGEIERERQRAELEARREQYRKELIAKGVSPAEAQMKAQSLGSGCSAILAIAVVLIAALTIFLL